jgi:hypothetical protein
VTCPKCRKSTPLESVRPDCVFTSPPYALGVDYGEYQDTIDNLRAMLPILAASWVDAVIPGGFAVINFSDIAAGSKIAKSDEPCEYPMAVEYWPVFRAAGWRLWTRRIWQKPHARVYSPWAIQSCRAASDWEHLWVWKTPGKAIVGRGEHSAFGVWDTSKEHGVDIGKDTHGAGMAVALPIRALETHSDGSRFEALIPPVVSAPVFTIRRKASAVFPLQEYERQRIMTARQREAIETAVALRRNILVVGGTGTGKTTSRTASSTT